MVAHKPSEGEEEFFAREEAEKKRRLALQQVKTLAESEREKLRALHHMRCPRCGLLLAELKLRESIALRCFTCHGIFLDEAHVEELVKQEGYWGRLFGFFARKDFGRDSDAS